MLSLPTQIVSSEKTVPHSPEKRYISLDLLEDSLQTYGEKLPHILVRNRGLKLNWSEIIEGDRLSKLKSKYQFLEIDFPGLRRTDIDFIDKKKQPFSQVMDSLPLLACIIHEKIEKNLKALFSLKHRDLSPTTVCDIYLLLTNNSLI
ncbi:MAG: hypothetical protein AB4368_21505, partial [Xenococcaceae cyanobacterium]